jgi:hypothetical protein
MHAHAMPAVLCRLLTAFACAAALTGAAHAQPVAAVAVESAQAPVALAAYDRFELLTTALDPSLRGSEGNERTRRELQMQLRDRLGPWMRARNAQPARAQSARTLRIEPTIVEVRAVDPEARLVVGPWAGTGQLLVRVRFLDAESGDVIAETRLRADDTGLTSVSTADAAATPLTRRVADALVEFLDAAIVQAGVTIPTSTH